LTEPFVDTDVIIRLLTGDDPLKQAQAAKLFNRVQAGELILRAPDTVIADAVFVLSSTRLYGVGRADVEAMLTPLVQLPGFQVRNRQAVARALQLYGSTSLDFGDAMIVATMEQDSSGDLYSYDADFDRIQSVNRRVPD
jgi:predicted nucleic acid-binding protein